MFTSFSYSATRVGFQISLQLDCVIIYLQKKTFLKSNIYENDSQAIDVDFEIFYIPPAPALPPDPPAPEIPGNPTPPDIRGFRLLGPPVPPV